ncbi:unnamed protein product [Clavelina lepadiformis]|uniref:Anaphase-promoting complex subunit 4-like WD40 domain-containing protein n=1 Tax=Clavelina lepadiformis TaxID=159417 RepID=A0ABP0G9B8_CLALP
MSERSNPGSKDSYYRRKKVYSGYHYRRRSRHAFSEQYSSELKHVLGLTLKSNCAFTCDPNTGLLAYPAGCVIVLYDPGSNKQSHIFNPGQKTITCLRFSRDGCFITTGEAGHQPCVRVFSLTDRCQVISLSGHKFGISSVSFSPSGKYVISIGYQHDNVINVWDWKKDKLAATNKVSTKVKSVAFAEDSSHFITVGNRHVKFWYLENSTTDNTTVPLKGRSAILDTLRNHIFCDVICGTGAQSHLTYAVTKSGILCQFNSKRTVEKFVELKCGGARTVRSIDDMILCGCATGSVHIFNSASLEFITEIFPPTQVRNQEIVATAIDMRNMWMHCVYSNHTLLVFDVMDFSQPQINSLFQFHNSCVWDVKVVPGSSECKSLPKDCFLTCSTDGSTRAWQCCENTCELLKVIKLDNASDKLSEEMTSKYEARSLCIRHDGKHLAIGDKAGNIHIYSLESFERLALIPTHDGDIFCMDYSTTGGVLASASRDRCVHTFSEEYAPTHTIADHSAAVTSVKFAPQENGFRLITCGADKSLYFCSITSNNGKTEISRDQHFVEKHSMSDMAVLEDSLLVACGTTLSEYDITGGKFRRSFRVNDSTATIFRIAVDSSRTLVANSCTDKHIYVVGFASGECLSVLSGHSEVAVALTFDLKNRLLSTSADSCVFVWSLTHNASEDLNQLQPASESSASTPESNLNKTNYFGAVIADDLSSEVNGTPRALNGNILPNLFNDDSREVDYNSSNNPADSILSTPRTPALPKWLIQQLPEGEETPFSLTPRHSLGKWGNKLEPDKVYEEIENLAKSYEVNSTISSHGDQELFSDKEDFNEVLENNLGGHDSSVSHLPAYDVVTRDDEVTDKEPDHDQCADVTNTAIIEPANSSTLPQVDKVEIIKGVDECAEHSNGDESDKSNELEAPTSEVQENSSSILNQSSRNEVTASSAPEVVDQNSKSSSIDSTQDSKASLEEETDEDVGVVTQSAHDEENFISPPLCVDPPEDQVQNSISLQEEINRSMSSTTSQLSNDDAPDLDSDITPQNSLPDPALEPVTTSFNKSDELCDITMEGNEEDVDIRNVIYGSKVDTTKDLASSKWDTDMTNASGLPTFVSTAAIQICLSPRSEKKSPILPESLKEDKDDVTDPIVTSQPSEEVNKACQEIVNHVLNSVNEVSKSDVTINKQDVNDNVIPNGSADHEIVFDLQNSTTSRAENDKVKNNFDETEDSDAAAEPSLQSSMNDESLAADKSLNGPSNQNEDNPEEDLNENDPNMNQSEKKPSIHKPAMPPAFAELLASLTKNRSPKVSPLTPAKSQALGRDYNSDGDSALKRAQQRQIRALHEAGDHNNGNESRRSLGAASYNRVNLVLNNNHSHDSQESSDSSCDTSYDAQLECQKASDDLLAIFDHAEAVYNKQMEFQNNSKASKNGNFFGFQKLVRAFQNINSRIGNLNLPNSINPEQKDEAPSRTVSLESLSDDVAVVSLLREYSNRLVDLVHHQVDNRANVVTEEADMV